MVYDLGILPISGQSSYGDIRDWPICPKVSKWGLGWLQVDMVTLNPHLEGRVEAGSGLALLSLSDYQFLKGSQASKSRSQGSQV